MAPVLNSNSFFLTTTPPSRRSSKVQPKTVFAQKAAVFPFFQFGKQKDVPPAPEVGTSNNSLPFNLNFGKLSDVKSLVPVQSTPAVTLPFGGVKRKDPNTVFVVGATGQAGIRIARGLIRQGFTVRAGVPALQEAQKLARIASDYKLISKEDAKRLNAVEVDYLNVETTAKAIGSASKLVVTIGPAQNGPERELSVTDAWNAIRAAELAAVEHVAIIYDTNPANYSTYNVIDGFSSFFKNLFSMPEIQTIPELLQKVVETNVRYTVVKTCLTDDYSKESSYNVVVSAEGRSSGSTDYKVSPSQIASLVVSVCSNTAVAQNKVVSVSTHPEAPLRPIDDLFSRIPEDNRRALYAASRANAKEEEAKAAAVAPKKLEAKASAVAPKKPEAKLPWLPTQEAATSNLAADVQEKAKAASVSANDLLSKAKDMGSSFSWANLGSQITNAARNPRSKDEEPKVRVATVRGQAKARSLPSQKAEAKRPSAPNVFANMKQKQPTKPKSKNEEQKVEVRKVFGGLFQQETIYMDD